MQIHFNPFKVTSHCSLFYNLSCALIKPITLESILVYFVRKQNDLLSRVSDFEVEAYVFENCTCLLAILSRKMGNLPGF